MNEERTDDRSENVREIPKWTRRYAQSRSIPRILSIVMAVIVCAAIFGPYFLAAAAYHSGNTTLLVIAIVILALVFTSLVFFSVPRWGGKWIKRMEQRLYASEGSVAISSPDESKKRTAVFERVAVPFACVMSVVFLLGSLGFFSMEYIQPVSAVYIVPSLVFMMIRMRRVTGFMPLLWPALYALHAILVVAGVPIQFRFGGKLMGLNMLIPMAGYGILSGLVGHIYNRFALHKLKRIAGLKQDDGAIKPE